MIFSTFIFSVSEFLATCQDYPYVMADSLLDVLTKGGHSRSLQDLDVVSMLLKKQAVYKWLWSPRHSMLWDQGLTSVTDELHSPWKDSLPWMEDSEPKRVSQLQDPGLLEHGHTLLILVRLRKSSEVSRCYGAPELGMKLTDTMGSVLSLLCRDSTTVGASERKTFTTDWLFVNTCELYSSVQNSL